MKKFLLILTNISVICLLLMACTAPGTLPAETLPQAIVTMPSHTPTYFLANPTTTLPISETPLPTVSLPLPTIMPGAKYQLNDWTPEKADQLIAILQKYPDTLPFEERGYLDSMYYWSFNFAAIAQTEAEFRFPDAVQTTRWRWARMFNRLQAAQNIGEISMKLILDALNHGEVQIADLENWFEANAPNMKLELISQTPILDYDSSQIILVSPTSVSAAGGGTYIWLLHKASTYTAYSLESPRDFYYGDGEISADFQDLTGDSIPEIIIRHVDWGSFQRHDGYLDIFDLSRTPPQKLSLDPQPGDTEIANVAPLKKNQNVIGLSMQIPIWVDSGGCGQFGPTWNYRWERNKFRLFQIQLPTIDELKSDPRCVDMLASHLMYYVNRDNKPAIETMKDLIGSFPYETTEDIQHENNNTIQSQDELRFKFGLNLFNRGYVLEAREQMEAIRAGSTTTPGEFTKYAKMFLDEYHSRADFLPICTTIHQCSLYFNVDKLVSFIPSSQFPEIINILKQMGLPAKASGSYDFDADGQKEYFLITNDGFPNFWIFYLLSNEIKYSKSNCALYNDIKNIQITSLRNEHGLPVFRATNNNKDDESCEFFYYPVNDLQKSISEDDANHRVEKITDDLLSGLVTPKTAVSQLVELQNTQILCADVGDKWCFPNASFEYSLGLSYELSDNDNLAVETYRHIWETYPESPYAIMAMSKLKITP